MKCLIICFIKFSITLYTNKKLINASRICYNNSTIKNLIHSNLCALYIKIKIKMKITYIHTYRYQLKTKLKLSELLQQLPKS